MFKSILCDNHSSIYIYTIVKFMLIQKGQDRMCLMQDYQGKRARRKKSAKKQTVNRNLLTSLPLPCFEVNNYSSIFLSEML